MALLQFRTPVNYSEQQEAFQDFLNHFKSFESASETSAAEAIEDLHIDEDGTSDEYDFMDDAENEGRGRTGPAAGRRKRESKKKYAQILQDVADRLKTNILIELDDLDTVRLLCCIYSVLHRMIDANSPIFLCSSRSHCLMIRS
jgi:DNA replication licensing factor MCM7